MPNRPASPCHMAGCPNKAVRRGYCETHAVQAEARYTASHPDTRPSASVRGYDSKWRMTRKAFLRKHPTCSYPGCFAKATDVDHATPRAQGGSDEWANLQALCHPHHSLKTATVDGAFGNPVRVRAGGRAL